MGPKSRKVYFDEKKFTIRKPKVKKPIYCETCQAIFTCEEKLQNHICRIGPFICALCRRTLKTFKRLAPHISSHFNDLRYGCKDCEELSTINWQRLKIHIHTEHKKPEPPCWKCSKSSLNEGYQNDHQIECYECDHCKMIFNCKHRIRTHILRHQRKLPKPYKCRFCSCRFSKKLHFDRHLSKYDCSISALQHWMLGYVPTLCRICEKTFRTEVELVSHFQDEHIGYPHLCFWCDEKFMIFDLLKSHIREIHYSKFSISCDECGKSYRTREGLRRHTMKHNAFNFVCKFCNRGFKFPMSHHKHLQLCKRNPDVLNNEERRQTRQLNWESRIVIKNIRGPDQEPCGRPDGTVDDCDDDFSDRQGWFDDYYRTEEDDLTFGVNCDDYGVIRDDVDTCGPTIDEPPSPISSESCDSSESSGDEIEVDVKYDPRKCRLCDTSFSQEYELIHHVIKVHPGSLPHKCPHCEKLSPLFAQLKEHMKAHGIGLNAHNCSNCSKVFRTQRRLNNHYQKCIGNVEGKAKADVCKKCGRTYQTKFGYKRHKKFCKGVNKRKRQREVAEIEPILCEADDMGDNDGPQSPIEAQIVPEVDAFALQDVNELASIKVGNANVEEVTQERNNPREVGHREVKCEVAVVKAETWDKVEKAPAKKESIKDDVPGDAPPSKDSFPCRFCPEAFQYERGIVMHFRAAHPSEKPLVCHICGVMLADKLKEHLKTHGLGEEFVCELCGRRFNQKFVAKIHELWHKGIEYKCENCKQKFLDQTKMEKHVAVGRCKNRQSLMKLPCDVCGKFYRSKFGLNNHLMTHTPRHLRQLKNGTNCEICGRWFDTNNGLERHRRIHTGERPFCCRFCPKAFTQEGNCKAHERIHTGEVKPRKRKRVDSGRALKMDGPLVEADEGPESVMVGNKAAQLRQDGSYSSVDAFYLPNQLREVGIRDVRSNTDGNILVGQVDYDLRSGQKVGTGKGLNLDVDSESAAKCSNFGEYTRKTNEGSRVLPMVIYPDTFVRLESDIGPRDLNNVLVSSRPSNSESNAFADGVSVPFYYV